MWWWCKTRDAQLSPALSLAKILIKSIYSTLPRLTIIMSSRLLTSFRSLSLNVSRTPLSRALATVSDTPAASTSAGTTSGEHQWQTRPARKLTAKERATPGRVPLNAPTPEGHLRPHLGVEVSPNHGLYGFFRTVKDEITGVSSYETIEPKHKTNDYSGEHIPKSYSIYGRLNSVYVCR